MASTDPSAQQAGSRLQRLPLVTLYLTERCNSRCVTCDYWRHGRLDASLQSVTRLLPHLTSLQTQVALISGGEPLLNPEWPDIARLLRDSGLKLWLLTSGLSLAKHARRVSELFDAVTVSLDGANDQTYAAIRGVDAFDKVCQGVRATSSLGVCVNVRVTLQRANYRELPEFVELARNSGARQVSFLAVDVANPHAFGREDDFGSDLALSTDDLPVFEQLLHSLEHDQADAFRSGFIAETPQKLRRIYEYFAAIQGGSPYPPVRCNAPEFSAVIGVKGQVQPCFFISGPPPPDSAPHGDLTEALNSNAMLALRGAIRAGARPECARCVCSLWRDPDHHTASDFLLSRRLNA